MTKTTTWVVADPDWVDNLKLSAHERFVVRLQEGGKMAVELVEMLNIQELCQALKISRTGFYRLRDTRDFPKPVRINRSKRWIAKEVVDWQLGQRRSR